ncbi:MAG: GatB/YqeY domain-containing protein [Candidatus Omnitrophota bacterium]
MLEEKIMADFKEAMKTKDQIRTQTLSFLRSEIKYAAIDKKKDVLDDPDVLAVIKRLIKQRQDSISQFEKGGRQDLVEKENKELGLLKGYLPQEMPAEELQAVINRVVEETQAFSIKDMGKVIKEVMARTQARADGKTVSDLVKKRLEGPS